MIAIKQSEIILDYDVRIVLMSAILLSEVILDHDV